MKSTATPLPAVVCVLLLAGGDACAVGQVVDSRLVFDFVSPDTQAAAENARVDWGHYVPGRHITRYGTLRAVDPARPAVWTSAVLNVNNPKVDWSYLAWQGDGAVSFELRGARDDGRRAGYVDEKSWTGWVVLKQDGDGRLRIPVELDGRQYVQLRATLRGDAAVTRIELHKKITLPGHPRIFVTRQSLARAKARIARDPEIRRIYQRYLQGLSGRVSWMGQTRNTFVLSWYMPSLAIAYHLSGERRFLEAAKAQLDRAATPWARQLDHFGLAPLIEGASVVLDILWNELSHREREQYAEAILDLADILHERWVFTDLSNQAYVNANQEIFIGIALAGERVGGMRGQKRWHFAEDRIRLHILPGTNGWAKDDGGFGEGHGYFDFAMKPMMHQMLAWSTATGEDLFEVAGIFRGLSQWRVYERRPWSGTQAKFNDTGKSGVAMPMPAFLASRYRDRHAQLLAQASLEKDPSDFECVYWWQHVLWYDPKLPPAADFTYKGTQMPLGRHFEGIGHVVCRSGWQKGDTWAVFKSGPYFVPGAHFHGDENSFVIDRKGALAIDSGGGESPRRTHYSNYFMRTIAHNTITVFDPNEGFFVADGTHQNNRAESNDGGQFGGFWLQDGRRFGSAQWGVHIGGRELALDGIVAFQNSPHYTYACGDAAKAYSQHKVSEFTREFLFIQPGSFVVFDRVSATKPEYKKTWLLHASAEPEMRGPICLITDDEGKLVAQTLLPADAVIELVGGPGKEFWVNGKNYPQVGGVKGGGWDTGAWRVEVSPPTAQRRDLFLHILHALDAKTPLPAPASFEEDQQAVTAVFRAYGCQVTVKFHKQRIGGHLKFVKDGNTLVDAELGRSIQPQRFDPETIWKAGGARLPNRERPMEPGIGPGRPIRAPSKKSWMSTESLTGPLRPRRDEPGGLCCTDLRNLDAAPLTRIEDPPVGASLTPLPGFNHIGQERSPWKGCTHPALPN